MADLMKIHFGMKAAPLFFAQLKDRIEKFSQLGMNPIIELHLFGQKDIFDRNGLKICYQNCESIRSYHPKFIVHFPHQDISGKIFDPFVDGDNPVLKVFDFSNEIGATAVVIHRYCCLNRSFSLYEAEQFFNERLEYWAEEAKKRNLIVFVENCGFFWLPEHFAQEYICTPLDHFFPWEINRFNLFLETSNINNVFPIIDVAHAALSINMLRLWHKFPNFRDDKRFSNITMAELRETPSLTIEDFIKEAHPIYLHISDSILFEENDEFPKELDIYLKSEGLPLGDGNIDFEGIVREVLSIEDDVIMILEIDPRDGNHTNNMAQLEGIEALRNILRKFIAHG